MAIYFKKRIFAFIWVICVSCTPEEIVFPDQNDAIQSFSRSNAIVSLFNEIQTTIISLEDLCFEFDYPISFKTHSGVVLEIKDETGLLELIENQTSGVYVDQVLFPVNLITSDGSTISDEATFQQLLIDCEIEPLPKAFKSTIGLCYELVFPFSVINESGEELNIQSNQALFDFYESQPSEFLLQLSYPITKSDENILIRNDFELYQLINTCEICPRLFFEEILVDNHRVLEASSDFLEEIGSYSWFIDDEFVEEDGPKVDGDNRLNISELLFLPGEYEVCIKADFELCDEQLVFCDEIIIDTECPEDLEFATELTDETTYADSLGYTFTLDETLVLSDDVTIEWFVEDELILSGSGEEGRTIENFFATGDYEICVKYTSDLCPDGVEVCQMLIVDMPEESGCPNLFFTSENIQEGTYIFRADFPGIETLEWYGWFIDGEFIEDEGTIVEGDNELIFTFEPRGSYEVCILTETPECPESVQYCETIVF